MSVPTWINDWWPEFYSALVQKNSVKPLITILPALEAYRSFNREAELTTFFLNSYGYSVLSSLYGLDPSIVLGLDSRTIYNVDNFATDTISRPSNFYLTNPEMEAIDEARILSASSTETPLVQSRGSAGLGIQRRFQLKTLFEDIPLVGTPLTKEQVAYLYFEQLNWKPVFQALNVGSLELPSTV